jgi:hypothetical protein
MKLSFALLPLATLFLGVLSSPTNMVVEKSVAVEQRVTSDPLAILQSFTAQSKQYTDTICQSPSPQSTSTFLHKFRTHIYITRN